MSPNTEPHRERLFGSEALNRVGGVVILAVALALVFAGAFFGIRRVSLPMPNVGESRDTNPGLSQTSTINAIGTEERPKGIPAMRYSVAQLNEAFPFGYCVYSLREGQMTVDPHPGGPLSEKLPWAEVKIHPDFDKQVVMWTLPNVSSQSPAGPRSLVNILNHTKPMTVGMAFLMSGVAFEGPPFFSATLSDDQPFPVFVLGLRGISRNAEENIDTSFVIK